MQFRFLFWCVLFFTTLTVYPGIASAELNTITLHDLSVEPAFIEADGSRNQIYVSLPEANQIAILSLNTLEQIGSINFVGQPHGLDLSDDGDRLYVALAETGTVATVDLNSMSFAYDEISVVDAMTPQNSVSQITQLYQVREVGGSKVFVTANTSRADFRRFNMVYIDRENMNAIEPVAVFNGQVLMTSRPGGNYVYVDARGSIQKFDITVPGIPRVLRATSSQGGGQATTFRLSNDGTRLYTKAAEIFDATMVIGEGIQRFERIAFTHQGASVLNHDEDRLYVLDTPPGGGFDTLAFSAATGEPQGSISNTCDIGLRNLLRAVVERSPNDQGLFVLGSYDPFRRTDFAVCYLPDDADGDGVGNFEDNCPYIENANQLDTDEDKDGDECDNDDDGDGVNDLDDDFPLFFGAALDTDSDGEPDSFFNTCDATCIEMSGLIEDLDDDNDGVPDVLDKFPLNNAASDDTDSDGQPDAFNPTCDPACQAGSGLVLDDDIDNDGILNPGDADPFSFLECEDADNDECDDCSQGLGDGFLPGPDNFPDHDGIDQNGNGICYLTDPDDDGDSVTRDKDNCPNIFNPDQADDDSDGLGDVCDNNDFCFPLVAAPDEAALICL